jgi:hypothetical protein
LLVAVAFAAFTISLLLAFASAKVPRPDANGGSAHRTTAERHSSTQARETTAETPIAAPAAQPPAASMTAGAAVDQPPPLWVLLAPWAFAVDGIAVMGLAAVLIVRYNARRRRGARM